MARPDKIGIDYFPFDVDFFDDEKIMAISGEYGLKGEITVIKLLCAIYRNGYFILWDELMKYKLLRGLPGVSLEMVESIVNRLVLWGFFDKELFDSVEVLTSRGIQERYFKATERRKKREDFPYLLVNVCNNGVNVYKNSLQDELMYTKTPQSKVKEIKLNNPPLSTNVDISPLPGETPLPKSRKRFVKPTVEEIRAYCSERGNDVDAQRFYNFYESKGWVVGKSPMKDWKAAVRTWEQRDNTPKAYVQTTSKQETDWDELARQQEEYIQKLREREQKEQGNGI